MIGQMLDSSVCRENYVSGKATVLYQRDIAGWTDLSRVDGVCGNTRFVGKEERRTTGRKQGLSTVKKRVLP